MGTKLEEQENPQSCLNKAKPDEPIFVMLGSDSLAPEVIRFWASLVIMRSGTEKSFDKARQALADAKQFEHYGAEHGSHIPGEEYHRYE
jgi:hypothetical protein